MGRNPTIFGNTDFGDVSDDVKKQIQQAQVASFFREREKDLDELRKRKLEIQADNRRQREEAKPKTAKIKYDGPLVNFLRRKGVKGMGRFELGTTPHYKDPGDGDLFGEGKVHPTPEPWMPMDMSRKDKDGNPVQYERGQGKRLTFSDTQPGSSRFVAPYEQKGFKEDWIKREMEARGYAMDDGPKGPGYSRALSEVQSMWFKQRHEWVQKKSDFMLGELREQNKNGAAPAQRPPQPADAQAADALAAQTDAGTVALQNPVVKPAAQQPVQPAAQQPVQPAVRPAEPVKRMTTVRTDDGRVTISGMADDTVANRWKSAVDDVTKRPATEMATGARVGGSGRYVKGGAIFFGADKEYEDYKKREGIV